jgi:AcrR family transcriptional regulator
MSQPSPRRLTRGRILRAAVRLLDREGAERLTIRRLAAELGVAPMSLYNHVPGKAALLDGVIGCVLGEMRVPEGHDGYWADNVRTLLVEFRQVVLKHPNVVPLLVSRPPLTPQALRPIEVGLEALRCAGFDGETTAHVYRLLAGWVIGFVLLEVSGFFHAAHIAVESLGLEPEVIAAFPRIRELSPHLLEWDSDREFGIGLDFILSGVKAKIGDPGRAR